MDKLKLPIHNIFGHMNGQSYCHSYLQSEFDEQVPASWLLKMDHSFEAENLLDMKSMFDWRKKCATQITFSKGILDIAINGRKAKSFESLISWYALDFIKTMKVIEQECLPFEELHDHIDPNHYLSEVISIDITEDFPQNVLDIYNLVIIKYDELIK